MSILINKSCKSTSKIPHRSFRRHGMKIINVHEGFFKLNVQEGFEDIKSWIFFFSKTQDQVGEGKHSKNEQKMKTPH